MARKPKLNSMRLLEQHRIAYEPRAFDAEIHSAVGVAQALGVDPEQVYKTLVALPSEGKPVLVMLAAERQLDTKALARALKVKRVQMASHREAESLTGLLTGGISALALKHKHFGVFLDRRATELAGGRILVSAGQRGMNLELAVKDLLEVTGAKLAELSAAEADRA